MCVRTVSLGVRDLASDAVGLVTHVCVVDADGDAFSSVPRGRLRLLVACCLLLAVLEDDILVVSFIADQS